MWAKHPAIARRWAKKYGDEPVKKKSPPKPNLLKDPHNGEHDGFYEAPLGMGHLGRDTTDRPGPIQRRVKAKYKNAPYKHDRFDRLKGTFKT